MSKWEADCYKDVYRYLDKVKGKVVGSISQILPYVDLESDVGYVETEIGDIEPAWFKPADPRGPSGGASSSRGGRGKGKVVKVRIPMEIFKQIVWEGLRLPKLVPKGKDSYVDEIRLEGYTDKGPQNRLDLEKTLFEIIKSGGFMHEQVFRYRDIRIKKNPVSSAVVVFARDKSGSISDHMVSTMRVASWWIGEWLSENYPHVVKVYVLHDEEAVEVDRDTFFSAESNGGTVISSFLRLSRKILEERYPFHEWNRYVVYFSDGDDWYEDFDFSLSILEELSKEINLFAYGQVYESKESFLPSSVLHYDSFLSVLTQKYGEKGKKSENIRFSPLSIKTIGDWLRACFGQEERDPI
jgi:uncharacterized sporulation protein YeaH/YhbH (DUF444 family)